MISRIESVYLALPLPALFPEKMNELMVGILQGRMPIIRIRLIFQGLRHPCRKISVELLGSVASSFASDALDADRIVIKLSVPRQKSAFLSEAKYFANAGFRALRD